MTWMRRFPLILLLVLTARAGDETDTKEPAKEPDGPFLWEATSEHGTAYLFGTIHIPAPKVLDLPSEVRHALDRADVVLTELELDPKTILKVQQQMMAAPGTTLEDALGKEAYDRISKKLKEANAGSLAAVRGLKPWAAMSQLVLVHGAKYFMSGRKPMDLTIPLEAKKAGKETGALETPEEQFKVFEELTAAEQTKLLEQAVDLIVADKKSGTNMLDQLVDAYAKGNLKGVMELAVAHTGEPDELDRKFMKALLDDRNVVMADRLVERMKKTPGKTWFIAVGAAHHYGEKGVPALLRAKGFKVTRVSRSAD